MCSVAFASAVANPQLYFARSHLRFPFHPRGLVHHRLRYRPRQSHHCRHRQTQRTYVVFLLHSGYHLCSQGLIDHLRFEPGGAESSTPSADISGRRFEARDITLTPFLFAIAAAEMFRQGRRR